MPDDKPFFMGQVRKTERKIDDGGTITISEWKYITVPADSPIQPGQYVKVTLAE
jgi:hypothetical protein